MLFKILDLCEFIIQQLDKQIYMYHSAQDRIFQKRQRVLSKEDLMGLSPQQREFAEQQFRLVYAQQMSRITADMTHKKKVVENLTSMDEQQSKNLKQQYEKLKNKMASIEQKRNKKLQQKVKGYKQNEQRWFNKLKQIQNKFKLQNREAIQKAKKYRQQSENFWRDKQKKNHEISRTHFQHSRTLKNQDDYMHNSFIYENGKNSKKYVGFGMGKRVTLNHQLLNHNSHRQNQNQMSKTDIDIQIKIHRQKSDNLQKQKQTIMFQKAMQKMQKIQQKRAKITKQNQPKTSQPTKPKQVDQSHQSKSKKKTPSSPHNPSYQPKPEPSLHASRSRQSKDSLQKLIKDHLEVKQRLEEQEFMQRGELLENSIQKARKERIMRMIKNKVQEIKVNTMMREGSKIGLLAS